MEKQISMSSDDSRSLSFFRLCLTKKKPLLIFNIIVIVLSVIVSLLLPNWYKSTVTVLPSDAKGSLFGTISMMSGLGGLGGGLLGGESTDYNRYLAILQSRTLFEKMEKKYQLHKKYDNEYYEDTLDEIESNIDAEVGDEMQIRISFYDKDQDLVSEMTNYLVQCLDSINIDLATKAARGNKEFIGDRLNMTMDSIITLENEITQFMMDEKLLDLENQIIFGIQIAAELKAQIISKEAELYTARKQFNENSPIIKNLELQIESLGKKYEEFFKENDSERLIPAFNKVPQYQKKYLEIRRRSEYSKKLVEFLGPQFEQARIEEAKDIPTLQILDTPIRPERKAKPKRSIIVLASLAFGLIFSLYYVYWKEYLYSKHFK